MRSERTAVLPCRFRGLPRERVLGVLVPVATGIRARLLGLAGLPRERAGPGLLLPGCRSVHTFGMRFPIDVVFLGADGRPLRTVAGVGRCRLLADRRARAVLELPAGRASRGRG